VGRFLVLGAVLALALPAAAASERSALYFFRTPTSNIGCVYGGAYLRCDVRGGIKPLPPRDPDCMLDWGGGYTLSARGRAEVLCAGDTALNRSRNVLRYGRTWRRGAFRCLSRRIGLRCRNASGRGFFLSRQHSYRF
jgi:hypothetical protein